MDANAIREALHLHPFKPFTLRLADGRALQVPHPDFVAVSTRRVIVINSADESMSVLEPILIVSLDYAGEHKTTTNGHSSS